MEKQEFFPTRKGLLPVDNVDPAAIAAAETVKARIQSAYIMALRKPRNEMEARDRILMACKRTEFAGKAEYTKPVGGKGISGPSIRFAELALREWGNILVDVQVVYEDLNIRRIKVSALDLETNAQFAKDLQIKKTIERKSKKSREDDVVGKRKNSYGQTVYILTATDEEMYTKEAAWVSKALRNEGLRLIPTDIIEEGMQVARTTVANRAAQDPEGEKKRVLDAFSSIGVRPSELEKHLKHSVSTISPAELLNLRTVYQSIRDGEAIWSDYVAEVEKPKNSDLLQKFLDAKKLSNEILKKTEEFCQKSAEAMSLTIPELKAQASEDLDAFWDEFEKWFEKNKKTEASTQAETPESIENWWDKDVHWKFLHKDSIVQIVRLGIGVESTLVDSDYPDAAGTLKKAFPETLKDLSIKYDKATGKEGAFKALIGEKHEIPPEDTRNSLPWDPGLQENRI